MASRSRLPRAERELQVLDEAHALFADRGFRDVTMDQVAGAVGVTKPLLYNYFGNKEQLYLACVARTGDELAEAVEAAVAAAANPGDALKAALRTFFALVERDERAWRVLYDETIPTNGVIPETIDGYRARLTAPVAAAFRDLGGSTAEAEALAHGQLAAAEAMSRWWLATAALPAAALAELLIDTLEPGLARRVRDEGAP